MDMKTVCLYASLTLLLIVAGCVKNQPEIIPNQEEDDGAIVISSRNIARMLAELPIDGQQLGEVFDAVSASSSNGYDEEYMMKDVLDSPGAGVGDATKTGGWRASVYKRPLKDLISEYLSSKYGTKAGAVDIDDYLKALRESGLQIYWPFSENWDGKSLPLITWDPGYGAESNYAYEIAVNERGFRVVDSLIVDESTAMSRPVWVVNTNNDCGFTPADMYVKSRTPSMGTVPRKGKAMRLVLKRFKMLRNYDSWFGGASEFFIKCGAPDGFSASTEAELKLYTPTVTDFMVVVKRKYKDVALEINSLILTNFTSQLSQLAFLVTEDDGGTRTSWKCSAVVKIESKSYGIEMDIPYNDKDDVVWRGQLSADFFREEDEVTARFGDVEITFALE